MINDFSLRQLGALPNQLSGLFSTGQQPVYKPDQFIKPSARGVTTSPARLNLPQWQTFPTGRTNSITDVPGIKVGQLSYRQDRPEKIRTGLTAIVPDAEFLTNGQGNMATTGFKASSVCLNGNGELTGASFINEFGVLNSPILLTNTRAVGAVHDGVTGISKNTSRANGQANYPSSANATTDSSATRTKTSFRRLTPNWPSSKRNQVR